MASMVRSSIYEALSVVMEKTAQSNESKVDALVWTEEKTRMEQQLSSLERKVKANEQLGRHVTGNELEVSPPFPRLIFHPTSLPTLDLRSPGGSQAGHH